MDGAAEEVGPRFERADVEMGFSDRSLDEREESASVSWEEEDRETEEVDFESDCG